MTRADRRKVVVGWNAGEYTFPTRWEAALFRWVARRWSGWTSWEILSKEERDRSLRPYIRDPKVRRNATKARVIE